MSTPLKGLKEWETVEGVHVLRVHFSADPDKDPDTEKGARWLKATLRGFSGREDPRFRKEYDIDVSAYTGQLLFPFLFQHEKSILINPFEVPRSWPLTAGFDYGARSPSAFYVTAWEEGYPVTVWEYYEEPCKKSETDEAFRARKGYKNTSRAIKNCPYFDQVMDQGGIAADPSLWAKSQQTQSGLKSLAELFEQEGIILFPASRGGDMTFYEMISNNFWQNPLEPKWRIFRTCGWLFWELLRLRFAERAASANAVHNLKDEIVDKNNHGWDAIKYDFMSRLNSDVQSLEGVFV